MSNTAKLKDDLHHIIDQIDDEATLEAVRTLLTPKVEAIYNVKGQQHDQDQIENFLEESEKDIEAGHTVSHQELKEQIQSWRNVK
ncbi:hypothetical protein WJR50_08350 [Catalinimonas sp. 4WD22]|uniref:hypothetical protein n=1 Tax=Catalinimonas locisalis TaxID=3133978 RepID=UPI0031014606